MIVKSREVDGMLCTATFSDDERYRYDLWWQWGDAPPLVAWMLNPSTATHEKLDPTIKGLRRRALKNEYRGRGGLRFRPGGVRVVNLFAYRATEPKDMRAQDDPVGEHNDWATRRALEYAAEEGAPVFVGWGKHGTFRRRDIEAISLLRDSPLDRALAFKLNADRSPQHPLYVPDALEPVEWWRRA